MSRAPIPARRSRRRRRSGRIVAAVGVVVVLIAAAAAAFALTATPSAPVVPIAQTPSSAPTASVPSRTPTPTPSPTPVSPAAQECASGRTLLGVWAHPDDDIIFANPTLSDAIAAGDCVRTVFVTAGDAGKGLGYVTSRELGILRAYDHMRGSDQPWDEQPVTLATGARIDRFTPRDSSRVSVLFLRLPDGNITDGGFAATGYATLSKLIDGGIPDLAPVDGGPAVTSAQLSASLVELAEAFGPAETLTHIPRGSAFAPGDHPDHSAVGTLVRDSLGRLAPTAAGLRYFVGYPSEDLPRTLEGAVLDAKVETYRIYTQQDDVIRCADRDACLSTRKFGEWLRRSYPKTEAELQLS